jgi:hypothetical protein
VAVPNSYGHNFYITVKSNTRLLLCLMLGLEAMDTDSKKPSVRILIAFIIITLFFVFLTGYTKYIFAKDYTFYIEAECNPDTTSCFIRDCEEYCPPNGLSTYSAYYIDASEYSRCTSNDCSNICQDSTTAHLCEPIPCDSDAGDECSE